VPEAPRLWYLEISKTALRSGFRRVHVAPCVFVVTEDTGRVCGILILHVDDGILAGDGSATYLKARKTFLGKLRIKKIQKNNIVHLKRRIMRQPDGGIKVDFKEAVARLKPIFVPKQRRMQAESPVSEEERTRRGAGVSSARRFPTSRLRRQRLAETSSGSDGQHYGQGELGAQASAGPRDEWPGADVPAWRRHGTPGAGGVLRCLFREAA